MKSLRWAFAAVIALSTVPLTADAQGRRNRDKAKTPAATAAGDKTRGMAETPGILAAAGLRCTPSDASLLGQSKAADGSMNSIYEVACSDGPGYVLITRADKTLVDGYECFALKSGNEAQAAEGKPVTNALTCRLPANADPLAGFRKLAQPLVPGCTIDQARYLGANPTTKQASYEIGCADRPGVILRVAGAGTPAGTPAAPPIRCEQIGADAPIQCQYTSKTEILAPITTLAAASGRQCQVTDGRYIGAAAGKPEDYYEAKCADGSGFLIIANTPANTFNRAIDCARATGAVSCSLTDAVAAQNQEASVYKALAVKGGFNCDVSQYRLLGAEQGGAKREVVELACKNQPEGVIAFFPAAATGKTDFFDCSKIGARNPQLRCSLTKAETINARLTKDVQSKGKTCQVTGHRAAGLTSRGKTEFVEVSCASGPGFMVEYAAENAQLFAPATGVFTCAEATNIGGGCKLSRPGATASR